LNNSSRKAAFTRKAPTYPNGTNPLKKNAGRSAFYLKGNFSNGEMAFDEGNPPLPQGEDGFKKLGGRGMK